METPTISESARALDAIVRMEERTAPRSLDAADIPASHAAVGDMVGLDTMNPFRDARGVGRVWCSLVAFPVF